MAFRTSSVCCLLTAEGDLGGGGTGPVTAGCSGLTFKGRACNSENYSRILFLPKYDTTELYYFSLNTTSELAQMDSNLTMLHSSILTYRYTGLPNLPLVISCLYFCSPRRGCRISAKTLLVESLY